MTMSDVARNVKYMHEGLVGIESQSMPQKGIIHHLDVLGPMNSDKMTYPYCLLLLDSYSRFPAACALLAPTAKAICDCMVNLWTFVGVPQSVSLDNASYNVAGLTTELFRRFAVTPRLITPHHIESNAAAERLIGTAKRMIAKAADDNPSSWQKRLPFTMWAMREVTSELTVLPPWLLTVAKNPRSDDYRKPVSL